MSRSLYRFWQCLLAVLSVLVLMASFYFQYVRGLSPCPLCLMQRYSVMILMMLCWMRFYLNDSAGARRVRVMQWIISLSGLYFAGRQMWLQSLPPASVPACMPDLSTLMRYFPWQDSLRALFLGAGECSHVDWHAFGLTMPQWSALYFIGMLIAVSFVKKYGE